MNAPAPHVPTALEILTLQTAVWAGMPDRKGPRFCCDRVAAKDDGSGLFAAFHREARILAVLDRNPSGSEWRQLREWLQAEANQAGSMPNLPIQRCKSWRKILISFVEVWGRECKEGERPTLLWAPVCPDPDLRQRRLIRV